MPFTFVWPICCATTSNCFFSRRSILGGVLFTWPSRTCSYRNLLIGWYWEAMGRGRLYVSVQYIIQFGCYSLQSFTRNSPAGQPEKSSSRMRIFGWT
ncbi:hypothetical protein HETIRDRAFT_167173 [Heterobasidion irregulare TC 32-1]|uniref:Uncharacterized protein n=1 Tax=Heterobasidion irregulare (strain TC 32-1) TaxID=747525 RepID=W4KRA5_HETIT|nr:uncharacterized protein HETIRDRAFT_167173 [Heterobasidion irregulare TC 32-1]ETW87606.1 hypothetical protein HETIRDRAFT_167173 [Heterobasidion irregulare TC 32-1]